MADARGKGIDRGTRGRISLAGILGGLGAAVAWSGPGLPWDGAGFFLTLVGLHLLITIQRDRERPEARIDESPDGRDLRMLAISRVTRLLGSEMDTDRFLPGVTRIALEAFDCDQVSILLVDPVARDLVVRAAAGEHSEQLLGTRRGLGEGIAGKVAIDGTPLVLGERIDRQAYRGLGEREPISASMVLPIHLREELVGVLCITSHVPDQTYGDKDLAALEVFADTVAVCLRHSEQAQWMRQTIERLEATLDARSVA